MRKICVLVLLAFVALFAVPSAHAATLRGYLFYVWHDVQNQRALLYIFDPSGGNPAPLCGIAVIPNLSSGNNTLFENAKAALYLNMEALYQLGPNVAGHSGVWGTIGNPGICNASSGDLAYYYISTF